MQGYVQSECTDLWNAYFEENGVDFIVTPSLWGDAITYQELFSKDARLNVRQTDGSYKMEVVKGRAKSFWSALRSA